jgi:type IV secretory pathway VirD2 relaxase
MCGAVMVARDDDFRIRPGRIKSGNKGARRPKNFVGEVMQAARKAGLTGRKFGQAKGMKGHSTFGRGRGAGLAFGSRSTARRVVVKARVVRHTGKRFTAAPLARHISYLKRDGVTRDGRDARMFDANSDNADAKGFTERCEEDRHHFRFIISPEDAAEMEDLKSFTRDVMRDMEHDLASKLDWVAVDHWNTDNPHIHVLVRGRADDGEDLVISRDYIARGLRDRATARVTLELGPRSELEIRASLAREVEAERWTSLDHALRRIADEHGGIVDLRPGAGGDRDYKQLLVGRAAKLERLGLAETLGPAQWTLKPGLEPALRDLSIRGDIIKTMHRAMSDVAREADVSGFSLHDGEPQEPVLGRLVERGLQDELKGTAYVIIAGVDGRTHHLQFANLEVTGDAGLGAIVETRVYDDKGVQRLSLAVRSDLSIEAQVAAKGATWLDRQLLTKEPALSHGGFGAEVREAMELRIDRLAEMGLAQRKGQGVSFSPDLLATLRRRELDDVTAKLTVETGLAHHPSAEGEHVTGIYRQRVILASGRFAMIDDGLGFQLVPWRPALEQRLGQHVTGTLTLGGGIDWSFGRAKGLGL